MFKDCSSFFSYVLAELTLTVFNLSFVRIFFSGLLVDGDEELIKKAKDLLHETATQYLGEHKASVDTVDVLPDLRFFYEGHEVRAKASGLRSLLWLIIVINTILLSSTLY